MDTEPNTEDLRSQVLQNTLQQISSLSSEGATECCVICLGDIVEQCEAQPCRHRNFDYLCLITWLEEHPTCPLCKSDITEVRYELGQTGQQGKVYKVPAPSASKGQSEEGMRRWAPILSRSPREPEDEAIQRRRHIYRHKLYSLHVGSNRKQPAESRYRELSPQLFQRDPELVSRARVWLRRELRVFEFLYADESNNSAHRRRPSNAEFLREYIIAILKTVDVQGGSGQAEDMIQEFLGRQSTRLLLHELRA
ncbi:hypothetical protein QBC46DRAFT_369592 [Diplogelasinospora grovesii]|uniref:RING-type E3 ubiquitin transferase n=1 Tax=Diplogelasinospora grovesii TaxID=303347 RepID=A0AAN6NJP4_9PEZI|nr:hypothetical protein QBC46DRAFT_369592 [Diplogelasinospora grovesii]